MVRFAIKLAGIPIGISAFCNITEVRYRDYRTDEVPIFSLSVTEEILRREYDRELRERAQAYGENRMPRSAGLEDQWFYRQIAARLPDYDAVLFHGSALSMDGEGYLFAAPSGTGKSTHARLWREHFGARVRMVNDDRPLLKAEKNGIQVCGSPWRGKHGLGENLTVPLKAVCFLERASVNHIAVLSKEEAFPRLLQQCYRTEDFSRTKKLLWLLEKMADTVKFYSLGCNMEEEAARISYEKMCEEQRVKDGRAD